jgi:hypothetical protein
MRSVLSPAFRQTFVASALVAAAVASSSCGDLARTGKSPAFLIIESIEAASGADPNKFGTILFSDVQTMVKRQIDGKEVLVPTIYSDVGRATFRLGLKNPGPATSPTTATTLNEITITRYRVVFRRSDGRATQGVDVPYAFDGAFTLTVAADGSSSAGFDLVRFQHKEEPPLRNMVGGGGMSLMSALADITFYGRDQTGNEVEVTGSISINFGDLADPNS